MRDKIRKSKNNRGNRTESTGIKAIPFPIPKCMWVEQAIPNWVLALSTSIIENMTL